jgi:hypothetical protein
VLSQRDKLRAATFEVTRQPVNKTHQYKASSAAVKRISPTVP